jgi:O-antigen/teichoic acid export membrane protein
MNIDPLSSSAASDVDAGRPTNSLVGKTSWSAIASATTILTSAVSSVLVARLLGPAGSGEISYSLWLTYTILTVSGLGISQAVTRYLAEMDGAGRGQQAKAVGRWLVRRGALLMAVGIVLLVGVEWTRGASRPTPAVLVVVVALYLAQGLMGLFTALLAGLQEFRRATRITLWASLIQVVTVCAGALTGGVAGATAGYLGGALLPGMACLKFAVGHAAKPEPALRERMRYFAYHSWVATTVSLVLWSRTEVFFIERYWGAHEVGMFTIGLSLAQLATQGPLLIGSALVPHFAQLAGARDLRRLGETYAALTRFVAFLVFPICLCLAALCPILVPRIYGAAFAPAVRNVTVLVAASAVGATASIGSAAMYAMERARFIAMIGSGGAIVGMIAFAIVIRDHGAVGAVWVRILVQLVMVSIGTVYIAYEMRLPVPFKDVVRIALSAAIAATPGVAASFARANVSALIWAMPLMCASYLVAVRATRVLGAADARLLGQVADRLPWPLGKGLSRLVGYVAASPVTIS